MSTAAIDPEVLEFLDGGRSAPGSTTADIDPEVLEFLSSSTYTTRPRNPNLILDESWSSPSYPGTRAESVAPLGYPKPSQVDLAQTMQPYRPPSEYSGGTPMDLPVRAGKVLANEILTPVENLRWKRIRERAVGMAEDAPENVKSLVEALWNSGAAIVNGQGLPGVMEALKVQFSDEHVQKRLKELDKQGDRIDFAIPPARNLAEKITDVAAGTIGFAGKYGVVKKFADAAIRGPEMIRTLAAWEALNQIDGGTPGMGIVQGLSVLGEGTNLGARAARAIKGGATFGGVAAAEGGDQIDVAIGALTPLVLEGVGAMRERMRTAAPVIAESAARNNGTPSRKAVAESLGITDTNVDQRREIARILATTMRPEGTITPEQRIEELTKQATEKLDQQRMEAVSSPRAEGQSQGQSPPHTTESPTPLQEVRSSPESVQPQPSPPPIIAEQPKIGTKQAARRKRKEKKTHAVQEQSTAGVSERPPGDTGSGGAGGVEQDQQGPQVAEVRPQEAQVVPREAVEAESPPWTMTRDQWRLREFQRIEANGGRSTLTGRRYTETDRPFIQEAADSTHRASVEAALQEGKPVPSEVLADYPDLKAGTGSTGAVEQTERATQGAEARKEEVPTAVPETVESKAVEPPVPKPKKGRRRESRRGLKQAEDEILAIHERVQDIIPGSETVIDPNDEGEGWLRSGYSFTDTPSGRSAARALRGLLPFHLHKMVKLVKRGERGWSNALGEDIMAQIGVDRMAESIILNAGQSRSQTIRRTAEYILANPEMFDAKDVYAAQKWRAISYSPETAMQAKDKRPEIVNTEKLGVGSKMTIAGEPHAVVEENPERGTIVVADGITLEVPIGGEIAVDEGSLKPVEVERAKPPLPTPFDDVIDLLGEPAPEPKPNAPTQGDLAFERSITGEIPTESGWLTKEGKLRVEQERVGIQKPEDVPGQQTAFGVEANVPKAGTKTRRKRPKPSSESQPELLSRLKEYESDIRKRYGEKGLTVGYNSERGYFVQAPPSFAKPEGWERWFVGKSGEAKYSTPELDALQGKVESPPKQGTKAAARKAKIEKARSELDTAIEKVAKHMSGRVGMNPDPETVRMLMDVARAYIKLGVVKFEDAMARLTERIGADAAKIADDFREAWRRVQESIPKAEPIRPAAPAAEVPAPEKPAVKGERPAFPTGIKNAVVEAERLSRGAPSLPEHVRVTNPQLADEAAAEFHNDPKVGERLVDSLLQKPRAITPREVFILLREKVNRVREFEESGKVLDVALKAGDQLAATDAAARAKAAEDALLDIDRVTKMTGTQWGQSGVARQALMYQDFSLAAMVTRARVANGGQELTPQEHQRIAELSRKIEETQKAFDEYRARAEEQIRKLGVQRVIDEVPKPKAEKTYGANNRIFTKQAADAAKARLLEKMAGRLSAMPDPTVLNDLVILGGFHMEAGLRHFGQWSAAMVRDLGESVRPYLGETWKAVRDEMRKNGVGDVSDRLRKAIDEGRPLSTLGPQIRKMARDFVAEGITDREELIDAVHEALREIDPNITRRQTMDAISGYGDFSPLSKDEISVILRDLKGQMQQIAKLEDMAAGKAPLKTGVERRTPSDAERRLIALVNEAKKKGGYEVTDPERQLRTALQTVKTRLRHEIADLEDQLRRKDFAKKGRRSIELDPEAVALKVKKAKLVNEYRKELYKLERSQWSVARKAWEATKEVVGLSKAVRSAFDWSALLRQAGPAVLLRPWKLPRWFAGMAKATISESRSRAIEEEIKSRPNFPLYESSGLKLTSADGPLSKMEENFMSHWAERIHGIAASERAYRTLLNLARADTFDAMVAGISKTGSPTAEEARAVANYVNALTGRGKLPYDAKSGELLGSVFWSPRMVTSRFQLLLGEPLLRAPARARTVIAKEYVRLAVGIGAAYGLARLMGLDIETDPLSSDFGKIRIGNLRIDLLSGLGQATVFLNRLARGMTKKETGEVVPIRGEGVPYAGTKAWDVITRFARSKLAPASGTAVDVISGEDYLGRPVTGWNVLKNLTMPLSIDDVRSAIRELGPLKGAAVGVLALLGAGIQAYEPRRTKRDRRPNWNAQWIPY